MTLKKFPAFLCTLAMSLTLAIGMAAPAVVHAQDEPAPEQVEPNIAQGEAGGEIPQDT